MMGRPGGVRYLLLLVLAAGLTPACTKDPTPPEVAMRVADSADQVMQHMTTVITQEGVRRSIVVADTAYIYQLRQIAELRVLHVTFFNSAGSQTSTLTARRGTYSLVQGSLDARGEVVLISTEGKRLRTEHLVFDKVLNLVRSDTAFVYDTPQEHMEGNAFTSDPDFKNVTVKQPKGRQKGKGMLVPGQ